MPIVDGDVQQAGWESLALWGTIIGLCWTHWLKNFFKYLDGPTGIKKIACTKATCGHPKCNSSAGHRFTKVLAVKNYRFLCGALKEAESIMFPMLADGVDVWDGKMLNLGDPIFERAYDAALENFDQALNACYDHYTSPPGSAGHEGCDHGDLTGTHSYFTCPTQKLAYRNKIDSYRRDSKKILTRVGRVHINRIESNHNLVRIRRPKGSNIAAVGKGIGEVMALLSVGDLQLNSHGVTFSYPELISGIVFQQLGLTYTPRPRQLRDREMRERLRNKRRRSTPEFKVYRRNYRARKRGLKPSKGAKKDKRTSVSGPYVPRGHHRPEGPIAVPELDSEDEEELALLEAYAYSEEEEELDKSRMVKDIVRLMEQMHV